MAVQQLTQPILNPIAAFDASRANIVSFVVIGGAQIIANRLVITNNRTGSIVYNQIQSTMKLEHNIPANLLVNGTYYNAVVYTIDSANNESVGSIPMPFYCYTQPTLTIDNIPSSEIIENGTYKFKGTYAQVEGELLDSYQYTLYDSNKNVLSQSPLIYYDADSSLAYTFVGMSNDTSYYVTLTGETINGTQITTGFLYFSVRYIQPASFAICDLVNNCENGYIQISSNVIAIDGKSNPSPPIYIDNKEVDLRDPESWVRWNKGFNIKNDFTMRVWGRDFNDNSKIITLTNEQNTYEIPNKIELKWMIGNIIKTLPEYNEASGNSIYLDNSKADQIRNLSIEGNSVQYYMNAKDFGTKTSHTINSENIPLNINVQGNIYQEKITQGKNYFTGDKIASGTGLGVNYSFNNSVLILNGTSTGTGDIRETITTGITMPTTAPKNGYICTARILSGDVVISSGKDYAIYLRDASSNLLFDASGTNINRQGGIVFSTPNLVGQELYIQIYVDSVDVVFNNLQIAIQIEENIPQNWFNKKLTPENYFYNSQGERTFDAANLYINQELITRGNFTFTYDQRYGGVGVFLRLCEYQADGTFIKRTLITDKNTTVTLDSKTAKVITSTDWNIQGGKYFSNPQLTSTNNYTDFEQYIYISNLPTPNYPMKIRPVGDNINYFNGGATVTNNGVTFTKNSDGSYNISGIATNTANCYNFIDIKDLGMLNNRTYIVSSNQNLGNVQLLVEGYNGDTWVNHMIGWISVVPFKGKAEIPDTITRVRYALRVAKGDPVNIQNLKIKIEEATELSQITPYSKYKQGNIEIKKYSKNLLPINKTISQTINGMNIYYSEKKAALILNGTTTAITNFLLDDLNIDLKNIDYTLSSNVNLQNKGTYVLKGINNNIVQSDLNIPFVFKPDKNIKAIQFLLQIDSGITFNNEEFYIQLEEGFNATKYTPYVSESYLLPIQQEMLEGDTFTLGTTAKKKENHIWNKIIFDGTEEWVLDKVNSRFYFVLPKRPKIQGDYNSYCTHFKNENTETTDECYNIGSTSIFIRYDKYKTLDAWKAWLKSQYDDGIPVVIYYKIVDTTFLTCTAEQSQILDKLTNNISYESQTNITTTKELALLNVQTYGLPCKDKPSELYALGDRKNLIDISDFNLSYNQEYNYEIKTNFVLKPDFIYTLSFNYVINQFTTDIYYSVGYGTDSYMGNLEIEKQYESYTSGKNFISFIIPDNIPENSYLWIRFAKTNILSNVDIDISNVQLESGSKATSYTPYRLYSINPTVVGKNLYNYNRPLYLIRNNIEFSGISQGYNIKPTKLNSDSYLGIGFKNNLKPGQTYSISFKQDGNYSGVRLYYTKIESEEIVGEIPIINNTFVAPQEVFDLQLVFSVDSSDLSNYLEIWNIQFEHGSNITEYENRKSNSSTFLLQQQVRGMLGKYKDLICLKSPNILNPDTKSANVSGSTEYYINQLGDTEYYIWYYNREGNLITFLDDKGIKRSGVVIKKGSFITHESCVKITITKYGDPDANDVSKDEILNNHISIYSDGSIDLYYPYISKPSTIRYIDRVTFDGVNTKFRSQHPTIFTTTNNFFQMPIPNKKNSYNGSSNLGLCNYLKFMPISSPDAAVQYTGLWWEANTNYCYASLPFKTLAEANQWLINLNAAGNPLIVDFVLEEPTVYNISTDAINALKSLKTFEPINNVFTDNDVLGNIKLEYVFNYSEQETQNNYALLKCWNTNSMPYICHSNYIDIPDEKDKIFIWMRKKNNLFDLKIENLGDYNEDDKPTDRTKPMVTLQIDNSLTTTTTITVAANSIDDNGLRAVRFSKDNGNIWDKVVQVDGLSSTNIYTFENLKPNTAYVIRVEAIDLVGNIGGISQNVMTKS